MSGEGVIPCCRERERMEAEVAAEERRVFEEAEMARHYTKHPHG